MRVWTLALVALVACAAEVLPPPPGTTSGTSGAMTTGGTGADTGTTGDGDGDGDTGVSVECAECYAPFCETEGDACTEDPACTCLLECEDGAGCEPTCGTSEAFLDLLSCTADAQTGPCLWACGTECESCLYMDCRPEFEECFTASACLCAIACDDDACRDACGAGAPYDTLEVCILAAAEGECLDLCA